MDAETLRGAVENAGFAAVGIAFLSGLFFSFNPVALSAIPVSLAYVTKAREPREAVAFGAMFIAGMIATDVALGLAAGLGGRAVEILVGRYSGLVLWPLSDRTGLRVDGRDPRPLTEWSMRALRATGVWGAFGLGVPFPIAACPFCTPALLALLGVVAALGSPIVGMTLLLAFAALGRAVPIAVGAVTIGRLENPSSSSAPLRFDPLTNPRPFHAHPPLFAAMVCERVEQDVRTPARSPSSLRFERSLAWPVPPRRAWANCPVSSRLG